MSSKTKNTNKGKRYSPAEKQNILAYVEQINKAKGRGGQKAAAEKFGVSQLTISAWKKALGAPKKAAAKKVVKKAAAKKVKKAVAKKAAKKAVAKKVKKAVVKKVAKKAAAKKVKKAVAKKVVKKALAAKNTNKGKRYSPAEKQQILDFVASTNKKKGRGGQTAAAEKYGVAALTIAGWIKSAGKGVKKTVAKKIAKKAAAKKAKKAIVKKAIAKKVKKAVKKPTAKKVADVKKAIAALKSALAALNA